MRGHAVFEEGTKTMKIKLLFVFLIVALCARQSFAGYILNDDFDSEHGGAGILNYNGFANWTVSDGTVDLIGNGYYDFLPGNGLYVDMDGSTGNAGIMTTTLSLDPGTYMLSFDLAGNQRNSAAEQVNVQVELGSVFSGTYSLGRYDPFTTFTEYFTVGSTHNYYLSFEGLYGDNIGMLLDNVKVSLVPLPATILLGFIGLGIGGWKLRKSM